MELHAGVTQGVAFGGVVIAWSTGGATETGRPYCVMELVKGDPVLFQNSAQRNSGICRQLMCLWIGWGQLSAGLLAPSRWCYI